MYCVYTFCCDQYNPTLRSSFGFQAEGSLVQDNRLAEWEKIRQQGIANTFWTVCLEPYPLKYQHHVQFKTMWHFEFWNMYITVIWNRPHSIEIVQNNLNGPKEIIWTIGYNCSIRDVALGLNVTEFNNDPPTLAHIAPGLGYLRQRWRIFNDLGSDNSFFFRKMKNE